MSELTIFVCTYNSSLTLAKSLSSVRRALPDSRLVVIDHYSSDGTISIALEYGAEVLYENVSLGHARQLAFEMTLTEFLAFVDSDVEVVQPSFFRKAMTLLKIPEVGAVVGMAIGHRLAYGLPAGLLVLRARDFGGKVIPDSIDARETFYIVRRLSELRLRTVYLADSMTHDSQFREYKPEWEGANTRIAAGVKLGELLFALKVILMLSLNSKSPRNIAYVPVFYLKFLRGFADPGEVEAPVQERRDEVMKIINEATAFKILIEGYGVMVSFTTKRRAFCFFLSPVFVGGKVAPTTDPYPGIVEVCGYDLRGILENWSDLYRIKIISPDAPK